MKSLSTAQCRLVLLAAFAIPISIVVAQIAVYLVVLFSMLRLVSGQAGEGKGSRLFLVTSLAMVLAMVVSGFLSIHPEISWSKLFRLILVFFSLGVVWCWRESPAVRAGIFPAFFMGAGVRAIWDMMRFPYEVFVQGRPLLDAGNMRDPQFYMCALLVLAVIPAVRIPSRIPRAVWMGVGGLIFAAFVLHNKRGSWLACALVFGLWVLLTKRYRLLLFPVVIAGLLLVVPQTRARLFDLVGRFNPVAGDRWALWTIHAPALIKAHPLGIGYKALRHDDLVAISPQIQPKLNHLHNNFIQVTAELGWHGLAIWSLLMFTALRILYRAARGRTPLSEGDQVSAWAAWICLAGLMVNGLVEYNWGDNETLMFYLLLLGVAYACSSKIGGPSAQGSLDQGRSAS